MVLKEQTFRQQVINVVKGIPSGKVMSYGQVAACAGKPRAAREVGYVLHSYDGEENLPWWRVLNAKGVISIKGNLISTKILQKQKLLSEGVEVDDNFCLDMEVYQLNKSAE